MARNIVTNFIRATPPITRGLVALTVLISSFIYFDFVKPQKISYSRFYLVDLQFYRMFTTFFYYGKISFELIMNFIFLYRYSYMLEESYVRKSDYFFTLLMISFLLLISSTFVYIPFLATSLSNTLTYIWSRKNPQGIVQIFGFVNFSAFYLPFIFPIISFVFERKIPKEEALGICVGHAIYYLQDVYPKFGKAYLITPCFLHKIFKETCDKCKVIPLNKMNRKVGEFGSKIVNIQNDSNQVTVNEKDLRVEDNKELPVKDTKLTEKEQCVEDEIQNEKELQDKNEKKDNSKNEIQNDKELSNEDEMHEAKEVSIEDEIQHDKEVFIEDEIQHDKEVSNEDEIQHGKEVSIENEIQDDKSDSNIADQVEFQNSDSNEEFMEVSIDSEDIVEIDVQDKDKVIQPVQEQPIDFQNDKFEALENLFDKEFTDSEDELNEDDNEFDDADFPDEIDYDDVYNEEEDDDGFNCVQLDDDEMEPNAPVDVLLNKPSVAAISAEQNHDHISDENGEFESFEFSEDEFNESDGYDLNQKFSDEELQKPVSAKLNPTIPEKSFRDEFLDESSEKALENVKKPKNGDELTKSGDEANSWDSI